MRFCKIGELGGMMWPTQMGGIFSAELCGVKSVGLWYIDKSGGVLKWPTQMGDILGVILVHQEG
jgi:hypothetical protein